MDSKQARAAWYVAGALVLVAGAYYAYRWWKDRQASSSSTSTRTAEEVAGAVAATTGGPAEETILENQAGYSTGTGYGYVNPADNSPYY